MLKKLEFAAVAVENLQEGAELYERLFGLTRLTGVEERPGWGLARILLGNGQESLVELIAPTREDSALARFLRGRGEGLYLLAFQVDDLEAALAELQQKGARTIGPEDAEPGIRIAWVHPRSVKGTFIALRQHVD